MIVEAYQQFGHANAAWDEPAKRALTEFARHDANVILPDEPWEQIISTNCAAAIKAGCDDPLMRYLQILFCMSRETNGPVDFAVALNDAALNMQKSSYPAARKLYIAVSAVEQSFTTYGTNAETMPVVKEISASIGPNLVATIDDKTIPLEDVYTACNRGFEIFNWRHNDFAKVYSLIEPVLFTNWPDESVIWLIKGKAYGRMVWNAYDRRYFASVTPHGWKTNTVGWNVFSNNLAIAESSLNRAWELNHQDARIAIEMMEVKAGGGQSRDQMELWFDRAMKISPDNYEACKTKLHYIGPFWYGSFQDTLDFGHECVQNTNWTGRVPLILADARSDIYWELPESEQTNYWKRPEVWHDIKTSYDRFFEINPGNTDVYSMYAWRAYQAEQWETFLKLAPKISPGDYGDFNNKEFFDKVVKYAKAVIRYNKKHGINTTAAQQ